jgi:hypothetical protein
MIQTNCGERMEYAGYRVADDTLTLEYSVPRNVEAQRCTCGYELDYLIRGLEKRNYTIKSMEVAKR